MPRDAVASGWAHAGDANSVTGQAEAGHVATRRHKQVNAGPDASPFQLHCRGGHRGKCPPTAGDQAALGRGGGQLVPGRRSRWSVRCSIWFEQDAKVDALAGGSETKKKGYIIEERVLTAPGGVGSWIQEWISCGVCRKYPRAARETGPSDRHI